MKKPGILGGTFDPIHLAHERIGHAAQEMLGLDEVMVIPTGNSYFKTLHGNVTSAKHRLEMVRLSIQNDPLFTCSDIEIRRQGYTFTADTLLELTRAYPDVKWYFILGADSLAGMKTWFAPEVICRHAELILATREDQCDQAQLQADMQYMKDRYSAVIHVLPLSDLPVSSSQIRQEIYDGMLPHPMLEPAVNRYIAEHGLYGKQKSEEEIISSLKKRIKPSRFQHTLGVIETAEALASAWHYPHPEKARLAALLHDCAKSESDALGHAPLGAVIAREEYGIRDAEILDAIRWHTTGRAEMSVLEKIIFIADYIEPGRDRAPHLDMLRKLAFSDPDKTIYCILEDTLSYLRNSGTCIDAASIETYNYYKNLVNGRKE